MPWLLPPRNEDERRQQLELLDALESEIKLREEIRRRPVYEVAPIDGYGRRLSNNPGREGNTFDRIYVRARDIDHAREIGTRQLKEQGYRIRAPHNVQVRPAPPVNLLSPDDMPPCMRLVERVGGKKRY